MLDCIAKKGRESPTHSLDRYCTKAHLKAHANKVDSKMKKKPALLKLHQMICHKVTLVLLRHYENWSIVEHYALSRKHLLQHFAP